VLGVGVQHCPRVYGTLRCQLRARDQAGVLQGPGSGVLTGLVTGASRNKQYAVLLRKGNEFRRVCLNLAAPTTAQWRPKRASSVPTRVLGAPSRAAV
jgi:hypothetical protein